MQSSVNISSEVLDWVIAHAQMNSLSPQIVGYLNLWVSGEKKPTFNQIEKVSKATGIPLGYFFLEYPPRKIYLLSNIEQSIVQNWKILAEI